MRNKETVSEPETQEELNNEEAAEARAEGSVNDALENADVPTEPVLTDIPVRESAIEQRIAELERKVKAIEDRVF